MNPSMDGAPLSAQQPRLAIELRIAVVALAYRVVQRAGLVLFTNVHPLFSGWGHSAM